MNNIKIVTLRFNLDKPLYKKAWDYLQNVDKTKFKSHNFAIATSVSDYFERHYKNQSDPYFETRECEKKFVQQIISEVEKSLTNSVPNFLTACLAGLKIPQNQSYQSQSPEPVYAPDEVSVDDIDFDFVGG